MRSRIADHEWSRLGRLLGCLAKIWSGGGVIAGLGHITLALLDIGSPESSTNGVGEAEKNARNWHKLQKSSDSAESSVWSDVIRSKSLGLLLVPSLQAEVSGVCGLSTVASLDEDEDCGTDDWDEVEWQVHEVADEGLHVELLEWAASDLGKTRDGVSSRLKLAAVRNDARLIACQKCAVKDINHSILNDEVAGQDVDNCGGFGENEEDGGERSQWAVCEEHERH